ncbi:hypothetical protein FF098_014345 [Parvularcula flava]|uniref:Uncharacterized protein n=1 Tax=Aquisalinus luteolus TaxID=1566827 RepID=A0A8J3EVE4_9PROT|nr:hypothetical protein [Aquisalinus luteolus]NHK29099.1 hypothetical protein [Aquisalinus luteolus]GGI00307.1 hypothetical protein GCM10011355_28290 [Aquisalinus luteolus]
MMITAILANTFAAPLAAAAMLQMTPALQQKWDTQSAFVDRVIEWSCSAVPRGEGNRKGVQVIMRINRRDQYNAVIYETNGLALPSGNYQAKIKYDADIRIDPNGEMFFLTTSSSVAEMDELPYGYSWGDTSNVQMMLAMKPARFGEGRYDLKGWSQAPGVIMDVSCASGGLRLVKPD